MGIKKINELLKKYTQNTYNQVHLSKYNLKKIAIDVSLYLFQSKARAQSRGKDYEWPSEFIYLVCCLRKNNIHPVFVFDTKAPIEKSEERKKRAEKRKKQKERIDLIQTAVDKYNTTGDIDDILKELCEEAQKTNRLLKKSSSIDIDFVNSKLEKLKAQVIEVCEQDFLLIKELMDILSVYHIQAIGEAEAMCCYLAKHNYVDAVMSEDTDVLAYGASKFLTKVNTRDETVVEVDRDVLLEEIKLSSDSFLDLCIMCGTDYNENIKGIGPEKSYQLIFEYKSIEKIEEVKDKNGTPKYDTSVLKYQRSRELFKIPDELKITIKYTGVPNFEKLGVFLKVNNLNTPIDYVKKCFQFQKLSFVD